MHGYGGKIGISAILFPEFESDQKVFCKLELELLLHEIDPDQGFDFDFAWCIGTMGVKKECVRGTFSVLGLVKYVE